MKEYKFKILVLGFALLGMLSCKQDKGTSRVDALPYYNEATFTPHWLDSKSEFIDTIHTIAPFELVNQDGNRLTQKSFKDKIYIVDFFFTACPGICPKLTSNMSLLQEEFLQDEDIMLLSHSVTPERDSVPKLKSYAEDKGIISGKWHLATGDRQVIYNLGRNEYFIEESLGLEKDEDEFLHTENFVLIDTRRHIRGIYNGLNKTSINQLMADIYTLKKEIKS